MLKVLFIGGTGNISTAVSRQVLDKGLDLTLLNRGETRADLPGAAVIKADINDPNQLDMALEGRSWDVVVNWIAYDPSDVGRDIELFRDRTEQYVFISSASCYQKPPTHPIVTESTPLINPFWEYSRKKIACEQKLLQAFREDSFPVTIVRPSYTYDTIIPAAIGGGHHSTIIQRIRDKKEIIVHGDGTSLWTNTHSEDFAVGFTGLLGHQQTLGHAFHITSDEVLTWNQIYTAMGAAVGEEPRLVHIPSDYLCKKQPDLTGDLLGDKSHSLIFDNSKVKRFVPEFRAEIPFAKGIRWTVGKMDAEPELYKPQPKVNALIDKLLDSYKKTQ